MFCFVSFILLCSLEFAFSYFFFFSVLSFVGLLLLLLLLIGFYALCNVSCAVAFCTHFSTFHVPFICLTHFSFHWFRFMIIIQYEIAYSFTFSPKPNDSPKYVTWTISLRLWVHQEDRIHIQSTVDHWMNNT